MNIEELQDDFAPVTGDFILEEEIESEPDEVSESIIEIEEEILDKPKKFKASKIFRYLCIVIVIGAFIAAISQNSYFKNYKTNFVMNIYMLDAKFGISQTFNELFGNKEEDILKKREESKAMGTTYDNESYLIPFENASNACYYPVEGDVLVAKSNYLARLDRYGKEIWKVTTTVINPILSVGGKYISIAENGGTKVCLYNADKLIFEAEAANQILNSNISSAGDVVVVTKKDFFKGAVEVFNKQGERVFSWASGSYSVMCADISPSGRRIAVGFLDDKEGAKGVVQFFNIKQEESYKTVEIPGSAIFKLDYTGETLNVFADNRMVGLSVHGYVIWDEVIDGQLSAFDLDEEGKKAVVIDSRNVPIIKTYSKRGNEKKDFKVDELPDFIDIYDNLLLYNNTRMIFFGKAGREQKYAAAMDVKGLRIIDDSTYLIIYSNSIEFVRK